MRSGQQFPNSQHFSNRPGLSDASPRCKRLFAIVDFGQGTQSVEIDCLELWLEESSRRSSVLVDAEMREGERTEKPAPGCTLVIRSIALAGDRKSTRLNSSHSQISYAVFCLKKKKRRTTAAKLQV